jgi:hypothetical protein
LSRDDVLKKFRDCLRFSARPAAGEFAGRLIGAIDCLESLPNAGEIARLASLPDALP